MALKNIPDPGFSGDDGSADPRLTAALAAWADDRSAEPEVLAALADARLLVPVVAILGEAEVVESKPREASVEGGGGRRAGGLREASVEGGGGRRAGGLREASVEGGGGRRAGGLRRDKTSDMAVPTLQAPDGRRALPAFTSLETLARWRPDARPVAVPLRQALEATAHEKADTLVLDLAGPVPYQLTGPALLALAEGRTSADPLADPAVTEAVRTVLDAEPEVLRAHLAPAADADGMLALALTPGASARETAHRVAGALAADEVLRARLVRGLTLALLPPDANVPGEPLFSR
ncbi:SseB family protein [Streptomyces sp. 5-10]|uniref:SseB family protein n=1 Tax=Streptomyces sp. 5-10 TaxID=878925 RepID=UPI00168B7B9C|nr:SseB family protein [Streptomyces sp. 5-10]MBD3010287.1 SseB family protein [Streptomyces sp. 5-10]